MSGFRHGQGRLGDATLNFTFDGKPMLGRAGDTVASALLANGVEVVGRSFKYHRPRGVTSSGPEETGALVTIGAGGKADPNARATMEPVTQGLEVFSQNCFPSPKFDLMSINGLAGAVLPGSLFSAGFYYKTFMWPAALWYKFYEPSIRAAAGMGTPPKVADPDIYDRIQSFCDVAVVGGGCAGLAAALSASQSGLRVVLFDEHNDLGGQLLNEANNETNADLEQWRLDTIAALYAAGNVKVLTRTVCWGRFDGNMLAAHQSVDGKVRQNYHKVQAKKIIIAAGSIERPLVFGNNDKPNVMLASGARRMLNHYGTATGKMLAVFTNNDSAYQTAFDYADAGIKVSALVDSRQYPSKALLDGCALRGIKVHTQAVVTQAKGWQAVRSIEIADLAANGQSVSNRRGVVCDVLAHSGGWTPQVQMASHGGKPPVYDKKIAAFVVGDQAPDTYSVGAAEGENGLLAGVSQALEAAQAACVALGQQAGPVTLPPQDREGATNIVPLWSVPAKGKQLVDIQHDVTAADVIQSHREGFVSVEHLKRYTTLGMANDQGRTSNVNALAIMAQCRGISIAEAGTTRFRAPIAPVSMGGFGGREVGKYFKPVRRTPMQEWHENAGAVFVQAGMYMRPQYYPQAGETIDDAYERETAHVRQKVGICDVTSLGKIEIVGPDAAEFLDRVYINMFSTLKVGKARYGVMLREDGIVYDDGTTSRFADDRFFMTTTTAKAGPVMAYLERCLEIDWPELKVRVSSVSERWGAMAVAGPNARATLTAAFPTVDFSNEVFPFMGVVHAEHNGAKMVLLRISFSGEMAFEVYAESEHATDIWQTIIDAGKAYDIVPYGLETLGALRIEKGHVTGAELDGRVTLGDVHMDGMASKKKWFVGKNLKDREGMVHPDRPQLVGLKSVDPRTPISTGSILVVDANASAGADKQGWVSSMTYSPELGNFIALGFLRGGKDRIGERIYAAYPVKGKTVEVEVVSNHFVDPTNERVKG
jgi:sarcosine oxidase subunit alpha|tara:strand:+ start:6097 stop:9066 length:2970 start_codon:yes stop_codon:yes gene_type:complete